MPGVAQHAAQHTHTREIIRSLRTVIRVHDDLIVQLRAYIWTRLREWRAQYTNSPNGIFAAQSSQEPDVERTGVDGELHNSTPSISVGQSRATAGCCGVQGSRSLSRSTASDAASRHQHRA